MNIRNLLITDAQQYLNMLKKLDRETEFMMYEEEERKTTLEEQKNIIKNKIKSKDPMFIVEVDDRIVGFLGGCKGRVNRCKHSLYIALGILKNYRYQGIGSKLMECLDRWAVENNIKRVELTVVCKNTPAINLYQKMGYKIEGTKKRSLLINGTFEDEYYMGKLY